MERAKPKVKLVGENGNVFNLMGICMRALKSVKLHTESTEMCNRIFKAKSYDESLNIMLDYVDHE
jgi:hypothetical protein